MYKKHKDLKTKKVKNIFVNFVYLLFFDTLFINHSIIEVNLAKEEGIYIIWYIKENQTQSEVRRKEPIVEKQWNQTAKNLMSKWKDSKI